VVGRHHEIDLELNDNGIGIQEVKQFETQLEYLHYLAGEWNLRLLRGGHWLKSKCGVGRICALA